MTIDNPGYEEQPAVLDCPFCGCCVVPRPVIEIDGRWLHALDRSSARKEEE